jgi:DNA-binding Lrp family transcriptional regulator
MDKKDDIMIISFNATPIPQFKEERGKDWIKCGEADNYPEFFIELFNKSAKHNAITLGKAGYNYGKGFEPKTPTPKAEALLKKCNRYEEGLNDIVKRSILDVELNGGFYLMLIPNLMGDVEYYNLEYRKCRIGKDAGFFYKEDGNWNCKKKPAVWYPSFAPNLQAASIFFYKEYRPGSEYYPLPGYIGSTAWIEADIEVGEQVHSNAAGGFTASKFIHFFDGKPETEEAKKEIERRIEKKFTGKKGKKFLISYNLQNGKKPEIDDLGSSDLTKENFSVVDKLIQQNIFSGHQITSPMLFGIKTEGQLGGRSELREAYEIFKNTYVNEKQQNIEKAFNYIARVSGVGTEWAIVPTEPISYEFSEATLLQIAPKEYILEKLGINPEDYPGSVPATSPEATQQMEVNEHLKHLKAREFNQCMSIIKKFKTGKIDEIAARTFLSSGYGLSEDQINGLLGIQSKFAKAEDVIQMFAAVGEFKQDFEIIQKRKVHFSSDTDAFEDELTTYQTFGVTQTDANILDLIKKDKRITPDVIAQTLNIEKSWVVNRLKTLEERGYLRSTQTVENDSPVDIKELTQPLSDISDKKPDTTEILIRYSYEGPKDDRNRDFCAKMLELDRLYSRTEIERISERLGYSVWDRRGGFWNKGNTISPTCRHTWQSNVVVKKKAK